MPTRNATGQKPQSRNAASLTEQLVAELSTEPLQTAPRACVTLASQRTMCRKLAKDAMLQQRFAWS